MTQRLLCFYLGTIALTVVSSCSKKDFQVQKASESRIPETSEVLPQTSTGFDSHSSEDFGPKNDGSMASEPIMVDGSYLVCFRDRHLDLPPQDSSNRMAHLGCGLFREPAALLRSTVNPDSLRIEKLLGLGPHSKEVPVDYARATNSQRWQWIGTFPESETILSLQMTVSTPQSPIRTAIVPLHDRIPGSVFLTGNESEIGPFQIRLAGTGQCLTGNPSWSYNASTGVASSTPVSLVDCSSARQFRATAFQQGWSIHTSNPNPPPASECLAQYGMNTALCNRSCLDRADFGRSNALQLWGCTTSVEAQSLQWEAKQDFLYAFLNGGAITSAGLALTVTTDRNRALEWELISLVP